MTISPLRQRKAFSEGLALGIMLCGTDLVEAEKYAIDMAVAHAWRVWPAQYRAQFSQIGTDLRNGSDGTFVMTYADKGKRTRTLYWSDNSPRDRLEILHRHEPAEEWVEDALDSLEVTLSAEAWKCLASDFFSALNLKA